MRLEPDERRVPDLTQEDWDRVVQWRPLIYSTLRKFGAKILNRKVGIRGKIGTSSFQWLVFGTAYGVDAVTILQDLESRALEAAAEAFHKFDAEKAGGKPVSSHYLEKVILRRLQDEFDHLRASQLQGDGTLVTYEQMTAVNPRTDKPRAEPGRLDPHDQD